MSVQEQRTNDLGEIESWLDEKIRGCATPEQASTKSMYEAAKGWVCATKGVIGEEKKWAPCLQKQGNNYWFYRKDAGVLSGGGSELCICIDNGNVTLHRPGENPVTNPPAAEIYAAKDAATLDYRDIERYTTPPFPDAKERADWYRKSQKLQRLIEKCGSPTYDNNVGMDDLCHLYVGPGKWYVGRCRKLGDDGTPTARPIICLDMTKPPVKAMMITKEGSEYISRMTYRDFQKYYKKIYNESLWEEFKDHIQYCANKPRIAANSLGDTKGSTFLKILGCAITPFMALYEGTKSGYKALKKLNANLDARPEIDQKEVTDSEDVKRAKEEYNTAVMNFNYILDHPRVLGPVDRINARKNLKATKRHLKDVKNQQAAMTSNTVNTVVNITNTAPGT